jgi:Ca2+-binding EF-hand superfamily protein
VLIGLGCGAALYAPAGSPEHVDSIFYRLDADRDGTLSLAEFTAFYVQAEQEATKTAKQGGAALELFQRLSGGQLFITKVQFWEASLELGLFEGLSHEQAVAKVNEEFPLADLDNSGTLNFDEFARYYRVMDGLRIKREHGVKDMDMF